MNQNVAPAASTDPNSPTSEGRFHNYRTNQIPWPVHVIWILFWIGAVYYILQFLIPTMLVELVKPPVPPS